MQPPYSKQVAKHPISEEMRVYFGDSQDVWLHTKIRNHYAPAVMLPPGGQFNKYQWPVKGREVLMLQTGGYQVEQIPGFAGVLLRSGAKIVRVLYQEGLATFRPQWRAAA